MVNYLTNKTFRAGAYLRLSIEDENRDNESISIKNQRSFIKDFALKNDIEIYDYYVDDGFSGGNFDRPGFKRLINDIECGVINCVITKDMSRLGREFLETGNYIFKYFPEHDIRYIAILENYDTLNPNGVEDILPFKAVVNDMYLKDISKKIKSVRHEKMKNGEFVSGTVPYGYKRSEDNSKKLVIDEYAASIVRRIFDLRESGTSEVMIARTLSQEGVLPPDVYKGKRMKQTTITTNLWKAGTVKHILKNEAYIGTLTQGKYGRVSLKSKKRKILPENKWIVIKDALPKIVSEQSFYKVNELMKHASYDTRSRTYDYLLKGLVFCADCGATMLVRRTKNSVNREIITPVYICRNYARYRNNVCSMHYYREDALNKLVIDEIKKVLKKYANIDSLGKTYENTVSNLNVLNEYENGIKMCKQKIVVIDKAISDLYKDRVNGIISNDEFSGIKKDLQKDRKEYESKLSDFELMISRYKSVFSDDNLKNEYIKKFLDDDNPSKQLIYTFINKIEINKDKKVKIFFNFSVDGEN